MFELDRFFASGDGRRPFQRRRVGRRRNEADGPVERRRERAPFVKARDAKILRLDVATLPYFSADAFASLLDPFELADVLAPGDGRRSFQRRRVGRRRNEADGQVERRRERAPFAVLPAFMFVRQFRRERFER